MLEAGFLGLSDMFPVLDHVNMVAGAWDLESFLKKSTTTLTKWFGLGVTLLGLIAVALAIWQITSGLMSHGKKQVNWGVTLILLLVGGALTATGGYDFVKGIAQGGKKTIQDLGGQTIVTFEYLKLFIK